MREFWNQRYSMEGFTYGAAPNVFFKEQVDLLTPGKILLPGDGEGRNGVYAATHGWEVTAFDLSEAGKEKATSLAEQHGVTIDYRVVDMGEIIFAPNYFECIALIYTHFSAQVRNLYHRKLVRALLPGGTMILEAFSKQQLGRASGGPKDLDLLYSLEELREDFDGLSSLEIWTEEVDLHESRYHEGPASLIRLVGVK